MYRANNRLPLTSGFAGMDFTGCFNYHANYYKYIGELSFRGRETPRPWLNWRASPHCRAVNLVRSGRKQP